MDLFHRPAGAELDITARHLVAFALRPPKDSGQKGNQNGRAGTDGARIDDGRRSRKAPLTPGLTAVDALPGARFLDESAAVVGVESGLGIDDPQALAIAAILGRDLRRRCLAGIGGAPDAGTRRPRRLP